MAGPQHFPVTIASGAFPVTIAGVDAIDVSEATVTATGTSLTQSLADWTADIPQPPKPAYASGAWHITGAHPILPATGVAGSANLIRAYPFLLHKETTISFLAGYVVTVHAANNFQLAIYANDTATGLPTGSELAASSNLSTAVSQSVSAAVVGGNVVLPSGIYWACGNTSSTSATFTTMSAGASGAADWLIGVAAVGEIFPASGILSRQYSTPVTFGTWSDLTAAVWTRITTSICPILAIKTA